MSKPWKIVIEPEGPEGFRTLTIKTRPDAQREAIRQVQLMSDVLETLLAAADHAES